MQPCCVGQLTHFELFNITLQDTLHSLCQYQTWKGLELPSQSSCKHNYLLHSDFGIGMRKCTGQNLHNLTFVTPISIFVLKVFKNQVCSACSRQIPEYFMGEDDAVWPKIIIISGSYLLFRMRSVYFLLIHSHMPMYLPLNFGKS